MSNIEQQIKDVVTTSAHVNFWHTKGQCSPSDISALRYRLEGIAARISEINKEWKKAQRVAKQALRKRPSK